ncbi:hypothetical protein PCK1_000531 [Pneumocystis canis]|nr:hypothetical protein PCK1_000531 [Pneumocystis canis]
MYGYQEENKDRRVPLTYAPQSVPFSIPRSSPVLGNQSGGSSPQEAYPSYFGVHHATAQMGLQVGRSAVMAGQEYVERNMGRFISITMLRHYFNVSNYYVISKIWVILFPWRHKCWSRLPKHSDVNEVVTEGYRSPREDINSPDMYIPENVADAIGLSCSLDNLSRIHSSSLKDAND